MYWLGLVALGGFRGDHVAMGGVVLLLSYLGRSVRKVRPFAMPFLLTGILYDSQRFYADYLRGPIHVTQPNSDLILMAGRTPINSTKPPCIEARNLVSTIAELTICLDIDLIGLTIFKELIYI